MESVLDVKISDADLQRIVTIIRKNFGYEFGDYATSSFRRRVERFIKLQGMEVADELCMALRSEKFFHEFLKEITVNTTELFRDPHVWTNLRDKVIPQLFEQKQHIKIWIPACSSGEESISMAILLHELNLLHKTDIVASDINNEMVEQAQSGLYMAWKLRQFENNFKAFGGKGNLARHYDLVGSKMQFDYNLIKNIQYKTFDLVLDTQFKNFDLILLRNVLIYFNPKLQEKTLHNINGILNPNGVLVLGAQESLLSSFQLDTQLSELEGINKIYIKEQKKAES